MANKSTLAAVAAAAAEMVDGEAPEVTATAPAEPEAPAAPTPTPRARQLAEARAERADELKTAGVSAQAALELLAEGFPANKATLKPLIEAAANGATEAEFAKAVVTAMNVGEPVAIEGRAPTNAIKAPDKGSPAAKERLSNQDIYAARAKAQGL